MKEMIQDLKAFYKEDPKEFIKETVGGLLFMAGMIAFMYGACWLDQYVFY